MASTQQSACPAPWCPGRPAWSRAAHKAEERWGWGLYQGQERVGRRLRLVDRRQVVVRQLHDAPARIRPDPLDGTDGVVPVASLLPSVQKTKARGSAAAAGFRAGSAGSGRERLWHELREQPVRVGRVRHQRPQPLRPGWTGTKPGIPASTPAATRRRWLRRYRTRRSRYGRRRARRRQGRPTAPDARHQLLGHPGDDRPAVAPADQGDVRQVFEFQHVDNVSEVDVEVDGRVGEVDAVAQPVAVVA